MSDYVKVASDAGDQMLAGIAESQETFLKAMAPYTEWAATQTKMAPPAFSADMPTVQEITEAQFAFASKLLKQQKKFTDKLFSAVTTQ
jgi:hypothetical protein